MTLAAVYHYPIQHFDFHRRQLSGSLAPTEATDDPADGPGRPSSKPGSPYQRGPGFLALEALLRNTAAAISS